MKHNMTKSRVGRLFSRCLLTALATGLVGCGAQDPKGTASQEIYSGSR